MKKKKKELLLLLFIIYYKKLYMNIHQNIMRKGGSEVTHINRSLITAAEGQCGWEDEQ